MTSSMAATRPDADSIILQRYLVVAVALLQFLQPMYIQYVHYPASLAFAALETTVLCQSLSPQQQQSINAL